MIEIMSVELVTDRDDPGNDHLRVTYDSPHAIDDTSHVHVIPLGAIASRMALYGTATAEATVEEIIHEAQVAAMLGGGKHPTKAQRDARRREHKVVGLGKALKQAGVTLPEPTEQDVITWEDQAIKVFGRHRYATLRGMSVASIPDPVKQTGRRTKRIGAV
jgi:hypothetical protein